MNPNLNRASLTLTFRWMQVTGSLNVDSSDVRSPGGGVGAGWKDDDLSHRSLRGVALLNHACLGAGQRPLGRIRLQAGCAGLWLKGRAARRCLGGSAVKR